LFIEDGINWLNGTVVLVRKGEMRLCRRYYRQDTQELLTPDNPVFEPFLLNRAEGDEVIGRVVRSSREY